MNAYSPPLRAYTLTADERAEQARDAEWEALQDEAAAARDEIEEMERDLRGAGIYAGAAIEARIGELWAVVRAAERGVEPPQVLTARAWGL